MGKEVLTLQLGSFANYVGAHYWNAQVGSVCRSYDPEKHLIKLGSLFSDAESPLITPGRRSSWRRPVQPNWTRASSIEKGVLNKERSSFLPD
jgi:hypothetical protein